MLCKSKSCPYYRGVIKVNWSTSQLVCHPNWSAGLVNWSANSSQLVCQFKCKTIFRHVLTRRTIPRPTGSCLTWQKLLSATLFYLSRNSRLPRYLPGE